MLLVELVRVLAGGGMTIRPIPTVRNHATT